MSTINSTLDSMKYIIFACIYFIDLGKKKFNETNDHEKYHGSSYASLIPG